MKASVSKRDSPDMASGQIKTLPNKPPWEQQAERFAAVTYEGVKQWRNGWAKAGKGKTDVASANDGVQCKLCCPAQMMVFV